MMSLLGGCWFPRELFPKLVQNITLALPSTWAMQGMLDLSLSGGGLLDILPKIAVLFGFALLFFGLAAWRFRKAA
jgi:ABC-2 type transport system permease protein